jgi:hypothetical protein
MIPTLKFRPLMIPPLLKAAMLAACDEAVAWFEV